MLKPNCNPNTNLHANPTNPTVDLYGMHCIDARSYWVTATLVLIGI